MSEINYTIDDKKNIINDWKQSGKTQREFCESIDLNLNTFRAWVNAISRVTADDNLEKIQYERPFFIRHTPAAVCNVRVSAGECRPAVRGEKYYITDDMDVEILKSQPSIKLYGLNK